MLSFVRCIKIATRWHPKLFNNKAPARAMYQNRYPLTLQVFAYAYFNNQAPARALYQNRYPLTPLNSWIIKLMLVCCIKIATCCIIHKHWGMFSSRQNSRNVQIRYYLQQQRINLHLRIAENAKQVFRFIMNFQQKWCDRASRFDETRAMLRKCTKYK